MKNDLKIVLSVVELVPLGPIVTHRISEQIPRRIKLHRSDRVLAGLERFELGSVVFIPKYERTVASCGCESSVRGIESNVVQSVNLPVGRATAGGSGDAVAFELEVAVFAGFLTGGVDVGDGDAAFDAADSEAAFVVEAFDLEIGHTKDEWSGKIKWVGGRRNAKRERGGAAKWKTWTNVG